MEIICSKTGSDGNFSVISDGKSSIVIDCGINYQKANKMANHTLIDAGGVLVTHVHSDHAAYVSEFLKKCLDVYATQETWRKVEPSKVYKTFSHTLDGTQIEIGTFLIKPFKVPHINTDGTACENYGFLIYSGVTKEKMLWATDCAYIENKFPQLDYICIECNYIDIGDYATEGEYLPDIALEKRRINSHLSLDRCICFLKKQDLSKTKFIKLLHLSKQYGNIKGEIKKRMKKEFPDMEVII